jgi:phytoene dehydrogenase-like protein
MHDVVIVGAGVAGLSCARALRAGGADCLVIEAADEVGGRMRTDDVDGFRLDRGFQVLLTAYPAAREWLDFDALRLGEFAPGARVATPDGQARVSDPWREPLRLWETLRAPIGGVGDKLAIGKLRLAATLGDADTIWARGQAENGGVRTSAEEVAARGFSPVMIERFLRPWLGGVFLERELRTPAAMLFFVYRMFSQGSAALPAGGMQRIPEQLAAGLGPGVVRLATRGARLVDGGVELTDGEIVRARRVVVATDGDEAKRLGDAGEGTAWRSVTCVHWAAPSSPLEGEPVLWLNGTGRGLINNLVVPSDVAADYAPPGQALVSTTVLGDPDQDDLSLAGILQAELAGHFGEQTRSWSPLAVRRVRRALPDLRKPSGGEGAAREVRPGLWVCGDHRASASIQGAMASGVAAAKALLGENRAG